jgi:hypothetical protein
LSSSQQCPGTYLVAGTKYSPFGQPKAAPHRQRKGEAMCKLSIARLLALVVACAVVLGAMPSQAQDQKPSVDIVTKP